MPDPAWSSPSPLAAELAATHGLFDLHIDTLIPPRLWGYDVLARHSPGLLGGRWFGVLDLPRLTDAHVSGAAWSITTNPFRTATGRQRAWRRNLAAFDALVARSHGRLRPVLSARDCDAARAAGAHAVALAVQGANAWQADLAVDPNLDAVLGDGRVTRATIVHLTDSALGATSSPLSRRRDKRLTALGEALIAACDRHRVWVDLAHAHPRTFADAVACHDRSLPLVATHTGVAAVAPHWRNVADEQIRQIADSGGVVGVIAASAFLRRAGGPDDLRMVIEHLDHVMRVGGEGCAAIGTDLDGAIIAPPALRDGLGHLRLIDAMVDAGWSEPRIAAVCAGNAMAAWRRLRGDDWSP